MSQVEVALLSVFLLFWLVIVLLRVWIWKLDRKAGRSDEPMLHSAHELPR